MKFKDVMLLVLAGFQPLIWWFIYSLLQSAAQKTNSLDGLVGGCVFSGMLLFFIIVVIVINKYKDK